MAVIKSSDTRPVQSQASLFNLEDLSARGQLYLEDIRQQAREILQQAQQEADRIRKQAEADGRAAAEQNAKLKIDQQTKQLVQQQLQTALPALKQAIEAITQSRNAWLVRWEGHAVRLSSAIAQKLIRSELSRQPEIPLKLIREALELAAGSPRLCLRLHPDDCARWGSAASTLASQLSRLATLETIADIQVPQGSCILETEHGLVDQTWTAQLARIEEELMS